MCSSLILNPAQIFLEYPKFLTFTCLTLFSLDTYVSSHYLYHFCNVSNLGVSPKFFKIVFNIKPNNSLPTFLRKFNMIKENFKKGTIKIPIEIVLSWKIQLMVSCMVVLKCMQGKPEHKLRLFSIACGNGKKNTVFKYSLVGE